MDDRNFRVWLPLDSLEKSLADNAKGRARPIQGFASTDDQDLQREIMVQKGLDTQPFLTAGYIDWDHKAGRMGPQYIIGEPESCELRPIPGRGEGLYIKGFLYENHAVADAAWGMLERMQTGESQRMLGFSVEGQVQARSGKFIHKAIVRHVALTHQPVNPFTYAQLAKSLVDPSEMDDHRVSEGCAECRQKSLQHLMLCKGWPQEKAIDFLLELHSRGLF